MTKKISPSSGKKKHASALIGTQSQGQLGSGTATSQMRGDVRLAGRIRGTDMLVVEDWPVCRVPCAQRAPGSLIDAFEEEGPTKS